MAEPDIVIDARSGATGFYRRFGLRPLGVLVGGSAARPRPVPMWLAIGLVERAFA